MASKNLVSYDPGAGTCVCTIHGESRLRTRVRNGRTGYSCRRCEKGSNQAQHRQDWKARNPDKVQEHSKRASLKRGRNRFGWDQDIDAARYAELLDAQGGGCAICGATPNAGARLAIDHNHSSGAVRGLLCTVCNWALGRFKDDEQRFRRAAQYLRDSAS